jgi:hypothetical protein
MAMIIDDWLRREWHVVEVDRDETIWAVRR